MEKEKNEMGPVLVNYIVAKAVQDIRSKTPLSEELAEALNKQPIIDELRKAIKQDDIKDVIRLTKSSSTHVGDLAIGLLTQYAAVEEVKNFLIEAWGETAAPFGRKHAIMYRLLDDKALDAKIKKEIRTYVESDRSRFRIKAEKWYGGPEFMLEACRSRLNKQNVTPGKAWMYYIESSGGSQDQDAVAELFNDYLMKSDPESSQTLSIEEIGLVLTKRFCEPY